jgi:hypothetical protein
MGTGIMGAGWRAIWSAPGSPLSWGTARLGATDRLAAPAIAAAAGGLLECVAALSWRWHEAVNAGHGVTTPTPLASRSVENRSSQGTPKRVPTLKCSAP